jgi:hypothetical protein
MNSLVRSVARQIARCDVEVYGGSDSFLLPRALRINGEVVYTPPGTEYQLVQGSRDAPLVLQLTVMPTSLKFLPGDPPAQASIEEAVNDAA